MAERDRIRAKLSDQDRAFLDNLRSTFSGASLRYIRFSDGEEIGRPLEEDDEKK